MKNVLVVCTTDSMIWNFLVPHIMDMMKMGMQVSCVCSRTGFYFDELKEKYGFNLYEVPFTRTPYSLKNISSFFRLKAIAKQLQIDTISCHEPVGGAMGRIVGHWLKCKVIYTAHGFHFYKGAPLMNWLIYYPIERFLSRYTDVLITINKEDYVRAKTFHVRKVAYIPGVGVDVSRFSKCTITKDQKRRELGIPQEAFVLLSVGELASRKNQQIVIDALGMLKDSSIYYVVAGTGILQDQYKQSAREKGIENQLLLLGPRNDIDELCRAADIFVHPSVREGLGIAPLEGMASGLPLISTYINGIKDYTKDGVTGCCITNPLDIEAMKNAILKMRNDHVFRKKCSNKNQEIVKKFDINRSLEVMKQIYNDEK